MNKEIAREIARLGVTRRKATKDEVEMWSSANYGDQMPLEYQNFLLQHNWDEKWFQIDSAVTFDSSMTPVWRELCRRLFRAVTFKGIMSEGFTHDGKIVCELASTPQYLLIASQDDPDPSNPIISVVAPEDDPDVLFYVRLGTLLSWLVPLEE